MRTITAIMGDGIGPEVMESAMRVVDATGVKIRWEQVLAGQKALDKEGDTLPKETIDSIRRNRVVLKGPCDTPFGEGFESVNVRLRRMFNLYTNIRPIKSMSGVKSRYEDVDLVVFREGVEGAYGGCEVYLDDSGEVVNYETNTVEVRGIFTYENSVKFFHEVFGYAIENGRKKITIVHKANIMKKAYGMFLRAGYDVAKKYPGIKVEDMVEKLIVDNTAQKLVLDPSRFDILATSNEHGDILSDLCAGLVGGLGLAPGANIGYFCAIFEAIHGTAPDIAGKGIANPSAMILSAAMMLDYIDEPTTAEIIRSSVKRVIKEGRYVTRDINKENGVRTGEMTDEIIFTISDLSKGA